MDHSCPWSSGTASVQGYALRGPYLLRTSAGRDPNIELSRDGIRYLFGTGHLVPIIIRAQPWTDVVRASGLQTRHPRRQAYPRRGWLHRQVLVRILYTELQRELTVRAHFPQTPREGPHPQPQLRQRAKAHHILTQEPCPRCPSFLPLSLKHLTGPSARRLTNQTCPRRQANRKVCKTAIVLCCNMSLWCLGSQGALRQRGPLLGCSVLTWIWPIRTSLHHTYIHAANACSQTVLYSKRPLSLVD
jgi:hypothetical protein